MKPHAARIADWLTTAALPLWSSAGIDPSGAGAWEALNHDGTPQTTRDKRLRVMPRQAYVYASAALSEPGYLALAEDLFSFAMTRGTDPDTGNLAARLAPDGTILAAPHDLYDLAFMHLAAAALIVAKSPVGAEALPRLDAALDRLAAERGWHEDADGTLPRRQNPHMHLFEAATELYAATGRARYRDIAETCLGLFHEVFLQPDHRLFEVFDPDWTPRPEDDGQAVEPGHIVEWIWLLDRHARVTKGRIRVDLAAMHARALEGLDTRGLLVDATLPAAETCRLWPQTELLRAGVVMARRGLPLADDVHPDAVTDRLFRDYLTAETPGGWYDRRARDTGDLLSHDMPASTFYHLWGAFQAYLETV